MKISDMSVHYKIRRLKEQDIEDIYQLSSGNELYYKHCPPFVTRDSIKKDMYALPPGKCLEDKYYIGFFDGKKLIAVMDIIIGYPNENTAFIGLFMMSQENQNRGNGSSIISESCSYLKSSGMKAMMLGYASGNPQSEHFWIKNGFCKTGVEDQQEDFTVVLMEKVL